MRTTQKVLAKRKKSRSARRPDPDYIARQKQALRRTHRQVIYLNDAEKAAVEEYCSKFGVKAASTLFRQATMSFILSQMDENHPTLF